MTLRVSGIPAWIAAIVAVVLAITACTPATQNSVTPSESGSGNTENTKVLNIGVTLEPTSLDPSTTSGAPVPFVLLYNVYETLVKVDGDNKIKPLLAKSWDISEDRKIYTFYLQDAKFASGKDVNAAAVVTSLQRIKDGKNGILDILNKQMSVVEKISAVDAKTVEIRLNKPSNNWLYNMTQSAGIIYDPEHLDNLAQTPAGSGPYTFKEWRKGESITLDRNEKYWGKTAQISGAVFRYYTDANAMTNAMLAGQLDIVSNLTTPEAIQQFQNDDRYKVLEGLSNGEIVMGFNHSSEPLKNIKVRQAINYALDNDALHNAAWAGKGPRIGSMVSPLDSWYEDLSGAYPYNPEKAKKLLKEAGYENGLKLRLRIPPVPYASLAAPFIVSQLKQVGIEVELQEVEWSIWLDEVYQRANYDLTIVAHVEARDMDRFRPDYYWRYDNPEYLKLLAEADASPPEKETELLKKAAKMLSDDAAADWLWLLPNIIITKNNISGISENDTGLSFDITAVAVK